MNDKPDLVLLVGRSYADILLSGQTMPAGAVLDKCQLCGELIAITSTGQKLKRENPGPVIVLCSPCGLKQAQQLDTAEFEIGSPECEEGLRRSAHARELHAKFLKGRKP
jgi:hypothetical protein